MYPLNYPEDPALLRPTSHEALDQLVHPITETSWEEHTYLNGVLTGSVIWSSPARERKIREDQYTFENGRYTQSVTLQYDAEGTEVQRVTETYTYGVDGRIVAVQRVRVP